jgi:hypothetical protein
MGTIGDCFDNSAVESFFGTMQIELLDEHRWDTGKQLARHVRLDRGLVQPIETALVLRDAQPCRLRTDPHARRSCGVINTTNLSAGPGEAHIPLNWCLVVERSTTTIHEKIRGRSGCAGRRVNTRGLLR